MTRRTERPVAPSFRSALSRSALALVVLALATSGSGCASATSIADLMADPFQHDGREVRIEGEVREAVAVLGPGVYRVDDGSGALPVVSRERGAPRSGSRVVVKGTFRAAFTVAGRSLAVLLEESRRVKR